MVWSKRNVLVLGVALLMAAPVWAQQRQGRGGRGGFGFGPGMGGPGFLLRNKSVQEELKLSEDQVKKITTTMEEINKKHQEERDELQNLEGEERAEKGRALFQKINDETTKGLAGILTPDQEKRLKQIQLQVRGAQAFTEAEVQKTLNLTDEQKDKIKTIGEDARKQMGEIFQPGGDPQEGRKKMTALRKETMDNIMATLNDQQKASWKEMTGAPFEMKMEGPPGGRRRGGNRQ
jgi:Spy/CpxP family protein refolding chaperone